MVFPYLPFLTEFLIPGLQEDERDVGKLLGQHVDERDVGKLLGQHVDERDVGKLLGQHVDERDVGKLLGQHVDERDVGKLLGQHVDERDVGKLLGQHVDERDVGKLLGQHVDDYLGSMLKGNRIQRTTNQGPCTGSVLSLRNTEYLKPGTGVHPLNRERREVSNQISHNHLCPWQHASFKTKTLYFNSLVPRPSSLCPQKKIRRGRPSITYHVTDVTDCGQFHYSVGPVGLHPHILNMLPAITTTPKLPASTVGKGCSEDTSAGAGLCQKLHACLPPSFTSISLT